MPMWKRTPLNPEIGKQLVRMQCLCGNARRLPSKIDIEAGSSATTGAMIMTTELRLLDFDYMIVTTEL